MTLDEITSYLHEQIPITRELGAVVEHRDATSLRIAAPLAPNLNHRSTAFGGSLSAVAILSGWALVQFTLRERGIDGKVVIQRSAVDYDDAVDGDFTATATLPPPADWDRFVRTLARHRCARVKVTSTIRCASGARGSHEGTYVALRR